jgi:hypothetical protein
VQAVLGGYADHTPESVADNIHTINAEPEYFLPPTAADEMAIFA